MKTKEQRINEAHATLMTMHEFIARSVAAGIRAAEGKPTSTADHQHMSIIARDLATAFVKEGED